MLMLLVALIVASCGEGETEETTTTQSEAETSTTTAANVTTTTAAATTTTAAQATTTTTEKSAGGMVPDPSSGATLVPYSDEDITAGDVYIYWYRDTASNNYLALYAGPGIAGAEGLAFCPGNSIAAPDFMNASNTPVEDGSCQDFPTETASVQVCTGGVWLYQTAIRGDLEGTLWGSLEWNAEDGTIKGLTSQFPSSSDLPSFEYGLPSYSLWDGFTSDGSAEINCDDPTP
jgi:hypothetical protein